jgi:hypothetical protein
VLTLGWFLCGLLLGASFVALSYAIAIVNAPELVTRTAELFTDGASLVDRVEQLENRSADEDEEHPLTVVERIRCLETTRDLVEIAQVGTSRRVTWELGATIGSLLDRVAKLEGDKPRHIDRAMAALCFERPDVARDELRAAGADAAVVDEEWIVANVRGGR